MYGLLICCRESSRLHRDCEQSEHPGYGGQHAHRKVCNHEVLCLLLSCLQALHIADNAHSAALFRVMTSILPQLYSCACSLCRWIEWLHDKRLKACPRMYQVGADSWSRLLMSPHQIYEKLGADERQGMVTFASCAAFHGASLRACPSL